MNNWIPVSDKLPEDCGNFNLQQNYLVTVLPSVCEDGITRPLFPEVRIAKRIHGFDELHNYIWSDEYGTNIESPIDGGFAVDYLSDRVTAWLPLIEPYKEVEDATD